MIYKLTYVNMFITKIKVVCSNLVSLIHNFLISIYVILWIIKLLYQTRTIYIFCFEKIIVTWSATSLSERNDLWQLLHHLQIAWCNYETSTEKKVNCAHYLLLAFTFDNCLHRIDWVGSILALLALPFVNRHHRSHFSEQQLLRFWKGVN